MASFRRMENGLKVAAYRAVDEFVRNDMVLGIGSGNAMSHVIDRILYKVKNHKLKLICIPTSSQTRQLIIKHELLLGNLDQNPHIDVVIDSADEVDAKLILNKGGNGSLLQEKIVASCAYQYVIVADYHNNSIYLGEQYKRGIPIEVLPMAHVPIQRQIEKKYGGELTLRLDESEGGPCITDNGYYILDWTFVPANQNWPRINKEIKMIPGVIETGLFVNMVFKAFFGMLNGAVEEKPEPY